MASTPKESGDAFVRIEQGDNSGLRARLEDVTVGGSEVTGGFQALLEERERVVSIPDAKRLRFGRRRRT